MTPSTMAVVLKTQNYACCRCGYGLFRLFVGGLDSLAKCCACEKLFPLLISVLKVSNRNNLVLQRFSKLPANSKVCIATSEFSMLCWQLNTRVFSTACLLRVASRQPLGCLPCSSSSAIGCILVRFFCAWLEMRDVKVRPTPKISRMWMGNMYVETGGLVV